MEEFLQQNKMNIASGAEQRQLDYNHVLEKLQDYILNPHNIKKSLQSMFIESCNEKNNVINKKSINKPKAKTESNSGIYVPKYTDTLFWCFYIIKNGFEEYENLTSINIVVEKKLKIDYVDKIRQNKNVLKKYKVASLTYIEDKLVNEKVIDIKTFFALCIIENINVMYIYKKTYFDLNANMSDLTYKIIHRLDNNVYGYEDISDQDDDEVENKLNKYKNGLFQITNIDKPVKSMSYYKVDELVEFCKKLGIVYQNANSKIKNKKELYEAFMQYF
jgi:hypothetical protein